MKKIFYLTVVTILIANLHAASQIQINSNIKFGKKKKGTEETQEKDKFSKEEKAKILDRNSYPTYDDDYKKLRDLESNYRNYSVTSVKQIREYAGDCIIMDSMNARYADYWYLLYKEQNTTDVTETLYKGAKKYMEEYKGAMVEPCKDPVTASTTLSDKVKTDISKKKSNNQVPNEIEFSQELGKFEFHASCARFIQGDNSEDAKKILDMKQQVLTLIKTGEEDVLKAREDKQKQYNAQLKEDWKKDIEGKANNTICPADHYKGADKETLKSMIINAWAKDELCGKNYKILKVYITGDSWTREKGYNNVNGNLKAYDETLLDVAVIVVPKDRPITANQIEFPEVAAITYYSIVKDNLSGGKISYADFGCNKIVGDYIMKSKVK